MSPIVKPAVGLAALLLLAACATPKAPPVQAVQPPPPPPVVQTDIVLQPADEVALNTAMEALLMAAPEHAVNWASPANGLTGTVKVLREGFDEQNRPCREYHSVIRRENLYKHSTGFLCRRPAGGWEVVDVRTYPLFRLGDA